eukprot:scaffold121875_cov44-Prasinocladus_malaysianus.AAC.1
MRNFWEATWASRGACEASQASMGGAAAPTRASEALSLSSISRKAAETLPGESGLLLAGSRDLTQSETALTAISVSRIEAPSSRPCGRRMTGLVKLTSRTTTASPALHTDKQKNHRGRTGSLMEKVAAEFIVQEMI